MTATIIELNVSATAATATLTTLGGAGSASNPYAVAYVAGGIGTITADGLTGDWVAEDSEGNGTRLNGLLDDGVRVNIGIVNVPSAAEIVTAVEADGGMLAGVAAAVGSSGVYTITATCKEGDDTPVSGARVTIQGTSYTETSDSDGEVRFNVDAGVYSLVTSPPSGYATPANVGVTVTASTTADVVLTETVPDSQDEGWIG